MSGPEPTIRAVTGDDLLAVSEVYRFYVEQSTATWALQAPSLEQWRATFASAQSAGLPFLVLEHEGALQGFAYLAAFRGMGGWSHTVEDSIYLRPGVGGRGWGSRLLEALLLAADPEQVREVIAAISAEATASLALHRRHGFVEVGRMNGVGHKFDRTLDCVFMQRPVG